MVTPPSLRGTKQSRNIRMDCFATARNDAQHPVIAGNEAKQVGGTSLRGTKQSRNIRMDCFATARNDGMPCNVRDILFYRAIFPNGTDKNLRTSANICFICVVCVLNRALFL